jgi:short-subunit dehydrogenase
MIIWITGASTGLGREVARQYAVAGHCVCVSARGIDGLTSLVAECAQSAGSIHAYALDVTSQDQVAATFARLVEEHGVPELSILNAGTSRPDSVLGFDTAQYRQIMDVNYMGTVNCLAALVPRYVEQRSGQVAVVASIAGYRGLPHAAAYCASKAALISMCESLQPELIATGVRLQLVDPGFVRTPLTDKNDFEMPFLMEVEDAAQQMRRGIESGRFEITFPKRFTWLVKTLRLLPYSLYLRLTRRLVHRA